MRKCTNLKYQAYRSNKSEAFIFRASAACVAVANAPIGEQSLKTFRQAGWTTSTATHFRLQTVSKLPCSVSHSRRNLVSPDSQLDVSSLR